MRTNPKRSAHIREIGQRGGLAGGKSKSPDKILAARQNGAKAGRPRKGKAATTRKSKPVAGPKPVAIHKPVRKPTPADWYLYEPWDRNRH